MAELGLNDDPPVVGGALYHCQQQRRKRSRDSLFSAGFNIP
jgi:hypothetical protein